MYVLTFSYLYMYYLYCKQRSFTKEAIDVVIEGPGLVDKSNIPPVMKTSSNTAQLLFVFGGSSEPGLVSEIQDPSPL